MSPCDTKSDNLIEIKVLFEASAVGVHAEVISRIESTDASLTTECNHVGAASISVLKVPEFVTPHLTGLSHTRFSLINDERNTFVLGQLSESLVEGRSSAVHLEA